MAVRVVLRCCCDRACLEAKVRRTARAKMEKTERERARIGKTVKRDETPRALPKAKERGRERPRRARARMRAKDVRKAGKARMGKGRKARRAKEDGEEAVGWDRVS